MTRVAGITKLVKDLPVIESIESNEFARLCQQLADCQASQSLQAAQWPAEQLTCFQKAGVYRWFVGRDRGGAGWSQSDLTAAYVQLSSACLASTFVLTQRVAALKRIAMSPNDALRERLLPALLEGTAPATVGISHLTTSRRHTGKPAMGFQSQGDRWVLDGVCPWVTGADSVATIVVGAEDSHGQQILVAVDRAADGVHVDPGFEMLALTESQTGAVRLESVEVGKESVIAGPTENVLASLGTGHSTGSYQTSALALGVANAAIEYLESEGLKRDDIRASATALRSSHDQQIAELMSATRGQSECSNEQIRTDANGLVLRATQAAMVAAKGTGFLSSHPVSLWCRQAFFFLVWSCPQPVREANLCELAGVEI